MDKKVKAPRKGKSGFQKFKNRLSFLIILVFAGFVFYMGWIQIRIPEGAYTLIYTKTGGYDKFLIEPGQFVWRWENLLPQNLSLHFVELASTPGELNTNGYLPSGEIYGGFIHNPDAFKFKLSAEYRFTLREEQFVSLIESGVYNADILADNAETYISDVNNIVREYILAHSPVSPAEIADTEDALIREITDARPRYALNSFRITDYSFPDEELYAATRDLYINEIAALREVEMKEEQSSTRIETFTARKMDLLRKYGEILSEFPVLLQYFGLDKEKLDPSLFGESEISIESP